MTAWLHLGDATRRSAHPQRVGALSVKPPHIALALES